MKANMILVVILAMVMATTVVQAAEVPVSISWLKIDGDQYDSDDRIEFELGQELDIRVRIEADSEIDVEDAQVEAYISGYRYSHYERSLVSDVTRTFDLDAGTTDTVDLNLEIPMDWDREDIEEDDVLLRIRVSNRNDASYEQTWIMNLVGVDDSDAVQVKSFTVSPSEVIEAGRPLSFKVKVENYGDDDLDDVYVRVSIPELGVHDDETLDELDEGETETFEELLIRVPQCAAPGTYTAEAYVEFDRYESTKETMQIRVLEGGVCEAAAESGSDDKIVISVPESAEVVLGTNGGVYPIMISNLGSTAKTFTLSASGADAWGAVEFDPATVVVVQPESVKTVYMNVRANEGAQAGAQIFKVTVDSEAGSKSVALTANLKENVVAGKDYQEWIFIGLIVLIVILIVLGLIIGLSKLRGDKEDMDDETQTYY